MLKFNTKLLEADEKHKCDYEFTESSEVYTTLNQRERFIIVNTKGGEPYTRECIISTL